MEAFLNVLSITWKGMLGIFAVMAVIYLMIAVLNKTTAKSEKKD